MTTSIIIDFLVILATMPVIFYAGRWFIESSSNIGDYFRLPRSVKGATFDAVASSFPELMIALFSVIAFGKFEVGVGTIAGSAIFNLLVITGLAVLVAPGVFKVSPPVVRRDSLFYVVSVMVLLLSVIGMDEWGIIVPIGFMLLYVLYMKRIVRDTKKHREEVRETRQGIRIKKDIRIAFMAMVIVGVAAYFLTEHSIGLAEKLNVSPVIIAFTIMAATTSLPDGVISVVNAKNGHIDDATSNVFGSNTFDISIGLGFPLLLGVLISGPVAHNFDHIEIAFGLLGSTLLIIYFFTGKYILKKSHGIALLAIYGGFLGYVLYLSLI